MLSQLTLGPSIYGRRYRCLNAVLSLAADCESRGRSVHALKLVSNSPTSPMNTHSYKYPRLDFFFFSSRSPMAHSTASNENQPLLAESATSPPKPSHLRRLQTLLGFSKGYNFIQCMYPHSYTMMTNQLLFAKGIFMCCLMWVIMMNGLNFIVFLDRRLAPGEWYWFSQPLYKCQYPARNTHHPILTQRICSRNHFTPSHRPS